MGRRLPIGAELVEHDATHFRVWAPDHPQISVVVEAPGRPSRDVTLTRDGRGYHSARVDGAAAGHTYRYRAGTDLVADPVSRFQPDGPFGPSAVVDPSAFAWTDQQWSGIALPGQVFYEMHVGTFTREGTWAAAIDRLPTLVDIGVTCVEVMPVSEFPGRFGWGYDGVFPFAPTHLYGSPDDMRRFVDRAHALGLGVVLDVVYNHLGPEGCVFSRLASAYFSTKYKNEWGEPLNFDDTDSAPVRELFVANAGYWIDEFHLDGLRLDATQSIFDESATHVLADIGTAARAAAGDRTIVLIAENEPQDTWLVRPARDGGCGLDALWNDDFHHSIVVALTGRREAYYSDHYGTPQELISASKYGYLFQGQRYNWQKQPRGRSTRGVPPAAFVNFLENHDQIANSGDGSRLRTRTTAGRYRAATALSLLMPGTPMLFQGQEFGASSPFLFFADLSEALAKNVRKGRAEFVSQFPSLASEEVQRTLPVPDDEATFLRCKLNWDEHDAHAAFRHLYRDLLALRRTHAAFSQQRPGGVDGAVLGSETFLLRYFTPDDRDDRLLLVNLGVDFVTGSIADPLAAPPDGMTWAVAWSSEDIIYGGLGTPPIVTDEGWRVPGHAAVVLRTTARAIHNGAER